MSNPKNRKIQSIWYDSQSYKNYIAQLEAEQNKIDESKKLNPNNLIKRIYSMDSGLITPVLFVIGKWIERFFITPIADIVNLSSTYTGTTSEVLVDDKSFDGDKGEWYEDIAATLSASVTTANGYSTGNLHVFVTANDAISHLLKVVFSGEAFCSSSHQSGAITIFDQRRINITNGSIEYFGNINQKLKITSKVTATSSATLSDLIKTGVSFEVTFGSGRSLGYAYGKTDLSFAIILSNFTNLNLNIGTDYLTKFGAIPEGETVMAINILVSFSLAAQMGNTEIESIDAQITNIAVTNTD